MTREKRTELIRHLRYNRSIGADYLITDEDADEIIKALEQEPCGDCISRQEAIDKMQELEDEDIKTYSCEIPEGFDGKRAIEVLKALPPVTPQPKTGYWIEQDNGNMLSYHRYKCSVCGGKRTGETGDWIQIHDCKWKYCPDCGAKMIESQESEE